MRTSQPVLLGGLFIGIMSALPLVSAANCCCLWVITGGMLTVYLRQQQQAGPLQTGDVALAGVLAGLLGAVLAIAASAVTGPIDQQQLRAAFDQNAQIPPEARQLFLNLTTGRNLLLVRAAVMLPLFPIVSMLGALLGRSLIKPGTRKPAAASIVCPQCQTAIDVGFLSKSSGVVGTVVCPNCGKNIPLNP